MQTQDPTSNAAPPAEQDISKVTLPIPVVGGVPTTPDAQPILEMHNVTKVLGGKAIVSDLNFNVRRGEIFGFIGPSGSGKTTAIRLLTGVFTPTSGYVRVMGVDPGHPERRVQEHIGYMPQLFVLYPNLTVRENLSFVAELYGMERKHRNERITKLLEFVELYDARNKLASEVSGGMQRRIELAASLLHDPPLLFADEPTAGIDPVLRGKFWEEFRRLRDVEGRTLFVTTQYVGESEYCDRVGVIREGRIVAVDTPVGLRRRAFGGDMIDVRADALNSSVMQGLERIPSVTSVSEVWDKERRARFFRVNVLDSGAVLPDILDLLNSLSCDVDRVEEFKPNFDEVFIRLMEQDEDARANGKPGATGAAHV